MANDADLLGNSMILAGWAGNEAVVAEKASSPQPHVTPRTCPIHFNALTAQRFGLPLQGELLFGNSIRGRCPRAMPSATMVEAFSLVVCALKAQRHSSQGRSQVALPPPSPCVERAECSRWDMQPRPLRPLYGRGRRSGSVPTSMPSPSVQFSVPVPLLFLGRFA
jgi:hypothetical protein